MLYKKAASAKNASVRGMFWTVVIGVTCGIYGLQPLLQATHKDEGSWLTDFVEIRDETVVTDSGEVKTVPTLVTKE